MSGIMLQSRYFLVFVDQAFFLRHTNSEFRCSGLPDQLHTTDSGPTVLGRLGEMSEGILNPLVDAQLSPNGCRIGRRLGLYVSIMRSFSGRLFSRCASSESRILW